MKYYLHIPIGCDNINDAIGLSLVLDFIKEWAIPLFDFYHGFLKILR